MVAQEMDAERVNGDQLLEQEFRRGMNISKDEKEPDVKDQNGSEEGLSDDGSDGGADEELKHSEETETIRIEEEIVPEDEKEDYLSSLPDDCILAVFEHLDRKTLDAVQCASRRIYSIATHRSLCKIKLKMQLLRIGQGVSVKTHGFNLFPLSEEEQIVAFSVTQNGENEFRTKQGYAKRPTAQSATSKPKSVVVRDERLPACLFSKLEQAMMRYSIDKIVLGCMCVSADTLSELETAVKGVTVDSLDINNLSFPEDSESRQACVARFCELLQKLNVSRIKSWYNLTAYRLTMFDEQFLVRFGARKGVALEVDEMAGISQVPHFDLSERNWSIIANYDRLVFCAMMVDTKWLLELFLMRLSSLSEEVVWVFSVSSFLNEVQLAIENTDTLEFHLDINCGKIVRTDILNYAEFSIRSQEDNNFRLMAKFKKNWLK